MRKETQTLEFVRALAIKSFGNKFLAKFYLLRLTGQGDDEERRGNTSFYQAKDDESGQPTNTNK